MSSPNEPQSSRYWSWPGAGLMAVGITMVVSEGMTRLVESRLGIAWRFIIIGVGVLLSIWGLKEIIVGFWPRYRRRGFSFHLPREGMIYLLITCVLLIGSIIGGSNTLMMVFCLLVSLWIMNGKFTFVQLQRLSVHRDSPARVMAGEPFTVSITLQNRKSWLAVWLMVVEDIIVSQGVELKPHVVFVRIPAQSSQRGHYQAVLGERGRYRLGPITINTRFPLGLVERGVGVVAGAEILVYPRVGLLRPEWKRRLLHATELVSHVRPQPGPFNDEMHRIREYRLGDDPRMIHWPTTARLSELMVREYRESRDRDLLLIVDAWLPELENETLRDDLERGLRLATTICHDQLRHSRESSLIVRLVGNDVYDWRGDIGQGSVDELLDAFAVLEPASQQPVAKLWAGMEQGDGRRRVIVISPRREQVQQGWHAVSSSATGGLYPLADVEVIGTTASEVNRLFEEA